MKTYLDGDVEARRNNSTLVDSANKVNYDLSGSMVVDNFELADVSCNDLLIKCLQQQLEVTHRAFA